MAYSHFHSLGSSCPALRAQQEPFVKSVSGPFKCFLVLISDSIQLLWAVSSHSRCLLIHSPCSKVNTFCFELVLPTFISVLFHGHTPLFHLPDNPTVGRTESLICGFGFFGLFVCWSHCVALTGLELSLDQAGPELRDIACLCLSRA